MSTALCWIRRDLRLHDHAALAAACRDHSTVHLVFVFDPDVLEPLKKRAPGDRRVQFIAESLAELQSTLYTYGSAIHIRYGDPVTEIPKLVKTLQADALYFNRDYTTYPLKRDAAVSEALSQMGRRVYSFKDHVCFEPHEILTKTGTPYHVFTPYSHAWRQALLQNPPQVHHVSLHNKLAPVDTPHRTTEQLLAFAGFAPVPLILPGGTKAGQKRLAEFITRIDTYADTRDFPHIDGTSMLSVYIRHGCLSIRDMVACCTPASPGKEKWLSELIWREFYQMIFYHYPEVNTQAFQPKFRNLVFPTSEDFLARWKNGQTGFPLIDAAMRCLNETGWMHNRLRMVVASFLSKTLLVDWKRGERYFSWKLLDYELPSNNGGWQWATGIGCDAAPYFRVFNPTLQSEKYDPEGTFIKTYCPELRPLSRTQIHAPAAAKKLPMSFQLGRDYPYPIVDYKRQRERVLALYRAEGGN